MPPPVFPEPAERRYGRWLTQRWTRLHRGGVEVVLRTWALPNARELDPIARQVDSWSTAAVARQIESVIAVPPPRSAKEIRVAWVADNLRLIRDVDADLRAKLAVELEEAVSKGRRDIPDIVQARLGVATSRARTIARTEVAKLNSQISRQRMEEAGIDRYEWSTSNDERVRPAHVVLDGTIRAWDDPHPTEGHPGSAVNCRCVALPVLE